MADPKHTLRRPFSVPDEPIEGLAIAIHREDDEDDYGTVSDRNETAERDRDGADAEPAHHAETDGVQ